MSRESANQFLEAVAQDTNLRDKFQSVKNAEEFLQIAEQLGYTFTTEELKTLVSEQSQGITMRRRTGVWQWLRSVNWLKEA
jgi:predicted ribosomally synthesized peptide with nif11-like leader